MNSRAQWMVALPGAVILGLYAASGAWWMVASLLGAGILALVLMSLLEWAARKHMDGF
jgi:hypothetical protein